MNNRWKSGCELAFSGMQAACALVLAAIAVWAFFFTPLPEKLISQLRSEITEAKANIEELTRTKIRLETESQQLEASNEALLKRQSKIENEIAILEEERDAYADQVVSRVTSQIVAVANHRLLLYEHFATIGSRYPEYETWLDTGLRIVESKEELESDPLSYRQDAHEEAIRNSLNWIQSGPWEIWAGHPSQPILEPRGERLTQVVGEMLLHWFRLIGANSTKEMMEVHEYLLDYYFANTVSSRGAVAHTGASFIESLKTEHFLNTAVSRERRQILSWLDEFLAESPELRTLRINVVFEVQPSDFELGAKAEQATVTLLNILQFRESLEQYVSRSGYSMPRELVLE